MEAPAEVEWSTAGNWRRRPAQPAPGSQILPVSPLPLRSEKSAPLNLDLQHMALRFTFHASTSG
ncbi:TPA: hypothetical protein MFN03_005660 [Klebsiella pneumoniae]|nr:hypothetical protein [Klebsiella pneumoniae]